MLALQRRRVHGHQHVGRVARGRDVVVRDVDLEGRHAGQGPGRGPDLGREVREGGEVVAAAGPTAVVNRSPASCMPSPESPAKRMTTRSTGGGISVRWWCRTPCSSSSCSTAAPGRTGSAARHAAAGCVLWRRIGAGLRPSAPEAPATGTAEPSQSAAAGAPAAQRDRGGRTPGGTTCGRRGSGDGDRRRRGRRPGWRGSGRRPRRWGAGRPCGRR